MYPGILISVWFTYGLMIQWADSRFLRRQCFQMGPGRGRGQPRPPSVGKLCTLQPFTWPSSQDKVRIVCQRVVMPGMLSSVSKCLLLASAEAPRALWTLISEVTGSTPTGPYGVSLSHTHMQFFHMPYPLPNIDGPVYSLLRPFPACSICRDVIPEDPQPFVSRVSSCVQELR